MRRITYETGQLINGLVFMQETEPYISLKGRSRKAIFKCYCGKQFETIISSVVLKSTTSCGCYALSVKRKRLTTHGLKSHELYSTWKTMRTRCYNKKSDSYKNYGSRGIGISAEFGDFKVWVTYVTSLPKYAERKELKLTLDRIDNNKGYERNNLKWSTRVEQIRNSRKYKTEKMKPYKGCTIQMRLINSKWIYIWNNKPYPTEYLCRKAIDLALIYLQKSLVPRTTVPIGNIK